MNAKKRYTHSFLVTLLLYGAIFTFLLLSFKPFVQPIAISKEQSISLNHIALVSQEKQEEAQKQEKPKEEVKKIEKEEPKKEVIKEKPKIKEAKKESTKEEKPTQMSNPQPKESNNEETPKKEFEHAQEAIQQAPPKNYEEQFIDENLQKIVKLIQQNIVYPKRARELHIQGEVLVVFTLLKEGGLENLEALEGHVLLKKSALNAIETATASFPKVEKDITIKVPIVYSLVK
ncbi:MAG: TonB family protein [Arcobacteraceae bacterium]